MKNSISLTIPSDMSHFPIVKSVIKKAAKKIFNSPEPVKELVAAVKELVENAVVHAYPEEVGEIEIAFYPFDYGIRVDVSDWGLPMSSTKHLSVPIKEKRDEGFNRIYNLTDAFDYINLGREGKRFYVIKYTAKALIDKEFILQRVLFEEEDDQKPKTQVAPLSLPVHIRPFQNGDEETIASLIYRNYGNSYIKDSFYFPMQILENEGNKYFSVVAESKGKLVGHFALIKSHDANIAEVGIVVVDPLYKGMGIMNRMFDAAIEEAKRIGLDALFGEAIMYHPFSQMSNLSHGFVETSLQLGKIPAEVALSGNDINAKGKRGPVLVAFRLLTRQKKGIFFPRNYAAIMQKTYASEAMITLLPPGQPETRPYSQLRYEFDPVSNFATLIINNYGEDFIPKFNMMLHHLQSRHCDMIYADINLETIPRIDKVVALLNEKLFFYSGIHYLKHNGYDYLQLQYKHSRQVGRRNMVCHSDFCRQIEAYIREDEKRVRSLPASC